MSETKTTVIAKDGQATILNGRHFHVLKSQTRAELNTTDPESFISYIEDKTPVIYYNSGKMVAYSAVEKIDRDIVPLATCWLKTSGLFDIASSFCGVYTLDMLEEKLMLFRAWMNTDAKSVLDVCRNLAVKKVVEIKRQKDNAGNFQFHVKTESGPDDWAPPETFALMVPLYEHMDNEVELVFDFSVSYKTGPEGVAVALNVAKPDIDQVVTHARKNAVEDFLSSVGCPKFWGTLDITTTTDGWKYKPN